MIHIRETEKELLSSLLEKYLKELSVFYDERAVLEYPYLDAYFSEKERKAYLICDGENPAGFALVNPYSCTGEKVDYTMAEFYICPEFRRKHLALEAAKELFSRHGGVWEIKYSIRNTAAEKLWNKAALLYSPRTVKVSENENVLIFTVPSQCTDTVLMVRPAAFSFNEQTAGTNAFQRRTEDYSVRETALRETDAFISLLRENGITVISVDDSENPHTPDSVFPNNWFSTHEDGTLVLYPMFAENRRLERKKESLKAIGKAFEIKRTLDLTHYEKEGLFLEGTGSMVLDRTNRICYACRSPRTSGEVLKDFCSKMSYTPVLFDAYVYHTNVMMSIGSTFAVICLSSIKDEKQRLTVIQSLERSGKEIIDISVEQMNCFAANVLEVKNKSGNRFLVMSQTSFDSLTEEQIKRIEKEMKIIKARLSCIEKNGGGSARCMMAEIFKVHAWSTRSTAQRLPNVRSK